ncbi:MAG TPA: hypothetical protein VNN07_00185, partial [Candidatus Tectomicrobia bacterium]|nr:hypothetical protein [Candidatus Tectomicrobia bacterium]
LIAALLWRVLHAPTARRALAAPVVVMITLVALSSFKGPYADLDPMNVYVWLLAGMLFGLLRSHDREGETR